MEIPVYLFTGFLESGKTTFIQEALEGDDFNVGERTLFLLCEEGEEEYHPSRFFANNVFFEKVEDEGDLTEKNMLMWQKKHKVERVIVEYNGMWNLDSLYQNMPKTWVTYQEMMFADANTFIGYNQNMRQLVVDKLKSAELIVFNRCRKDRTGVFDKMSYHKIVRGINRKSQIIYEYGKDDVEMDDIEDPLPFDINAKEILVEDSAYAQWYRDINEETQKYIGKIVTVKGRCALGGGMSDDKFILGRHVMTCCVEDIQFAGWVYQFDGKPKALQHGEWYTVKGKVDLKFDSMYGEKGPVIHVIDVNPADEADPEVATF